MASPPPPPAPPSAPPAPAGPLVDPQLRARVVAALNHFLRAIYTNHAGYLITRARKYEDVCHGQAVTLPHYCMLVKQGVNKIVQAYYKNHPGTERNLDKETHQIIGILDANFRKFRVVPVSVPVVNTSRAGAGAAASAVSRVFPARVDPTATLDPTTASSANPRAVGANKGPSATRLVNGPTGWTPVTNPTAPAAGTGNESSSFDANHNNAPSRPRRTNRAAKTSRSCAEPTVDQIPEKAGCSPGVTQFLGSLGMVPNAELGQNLPNGSAADIVNAPGIANDPNATNLANLNGINPNLLFTGIDNVVNPDLLNTSTKNTSMADLSNPSALMDGANRAANAMAANPMAINAMPPNPMAGSAMATNDMAANVLSANYLPANAMATNPMTTNPVSANPMPASNTASYAITGNAMASNLITPNALAVNAMIPDSMAYPTMAPNPHVNQAHTNVPMTTMNNPNLNATAIPNNTIPTPTMDTAILTNPNTNSVPHPLQQQLLVHTPPYMPAGNPQLAQRNSVPVSMATTASRKIESSSRAKASTRSRGRGRGRGTSARNASRKRNSSAAGIQQPPMTSAPAHRPHKTTTTQFSKASIQSQTRALRTTTQKMRGDNKQTVPEKKAASNELENRVFLNDTAFVTVYDVAATAASCGYKLDEKTIRGLAPAEVIRFYVSVRQDALRKACKSASKGNGKLRISAEHLDAIGIQYHTIDPSATNAMQTSPDKASMRLEQNSSPILGAQDTSASVPAIPNIPRVLRGAINNVQHETGMQKPHVMSGSPPGRPVQSQSDPKSTKELKTSVGVTQRPISSSGPALDASQRIGTRKNAPEHQSDATHQLSLSHPTTGQTPAVEANSKRSAPSNDTKLNQQSQLGTVSPQNNPGDVVARLKRFQQKYTRYLGPVKTALARLAEMNCTGQPQFISFQHIIILLTKPVSSSKHLSMEFIDKVEIFLRDFLVLYRNLHQNQTAKQKKEQKETAMVPNADALNCDPDIQIVPESEKAAISNEEASNPPSAAKIQTPASAVLENEKAGSMNVEASSPPSAPSKQIPSQAQIAMIGAGKRRNAPAEEKTPKVEAQTIQKNEIKTQVAAKEEVQPKASTKDQISGAVDAKKPVPASALEDVQEKPQAMTERVEENAYFEVMDKVRKIHESVSMAIHDVELCEKNLSEEALLSEKRARIAEVVLALQDDEDREQARETDAKTESNDSSYDTLKEAVTAEIDDVFEVHKRIRVDIKEEMNKPMVNCLLAYDSLYLPKIVIRVTGTYLQEKCATFHFEKPPFGWTGVVAEIREKFHELREEEKTVGTLLTAWATAAEHLLGP